MKRLALEMGLLSLWTGLAISATVRNPETPASEIGIDPAQIVRDASWNELHAHGAVHPFRFRLSKQAPKGSNVKEIVETKEGDVARLLETDGRPLSPEAEQAEMDRLNNLLAHPEIQQHRFQKEQADSAHGDEMVSLLPDAFLYTADGMVQAAGGPCYRFRFRPNPAYNPPDREAEVFRGMEGELWVDQRQKRLVRIDAHLTSDVNFGWGVIGRLYKGGSILVEDADVGMGHWETTHMELKLKGKILLMKSVDFSTTEDATDFHAVPPEIGYREAVQILKQTAAPQMAQR